MKKAVIGMVWLVFSLSHAVTAKTAYERNITFSFQVNNQAALQLENKYGNVTFYRWDKNQIQANITITVKAESEEQARKIAGEIAIEKSQSGNTVSLHTNYNVSNASSSFWNLFFNSGSVGRKNIRIDYKVYVPASLGKLTVQNKYGDVAGNHIPGDVEVVLHYGNFHLSDLPGHLKLDVDYGDGSLIDIASGTVHADYTDFHIDKVQNLQIRYKYSDLTIGQAGNVVLNGSYGDISAESIGNLQSQTAYGDYRIRNLDMRAAISSAYGDVHIDRTGRGLKQLSVTTRYADLFVGFPEELRIKVQVNLSYGDFDRGSVSLQEVEKSEKGAQIVYAGRSPGAGSGAAVVSVTGAYSDVRFSKK